MTAISIDEDLELPELTLPSVELRAPAVCSNNLDSYVRYAESLPILTREEENECFASWHNEQNTLAAQKLVLSHLRYVIRVARGYLGYGLALADLIQEGSIGLMKAVKKFQPEKGARLVTFAMHWIKAEIHEYIIRNWRSVKIATTKAQRKLFFKLRSKKADIGWLSNKEVKQIASELGVKETEVLHMENRLSCHDLPFDAPKEEADDNLALLPVEYLADQSLSPEYLINQQEKNNYYHKDLHKAIKSLDERSQIIVQQRWLQEEGTEKVTLGDLAERFGISKERVRQIEAKAIQQLKSFLLETSSM